MKIEFSIICVLLFLNSYSQEKKIHFKYALVYDHGSRNQQVYYIADSLNSNVFIQSWTQEGASLNLLQNYDYTLKYKMHSYPLKIDSQRKAKINKHLSVVKQVDTRLRFNIIIRENRKDTALGIVGNYYLLTDSLSIYADTLHICISENYKINNSNLSLSNFYNIQANLAEGLILKISRTNIRSEIALEYELKQIENIKEFIIINLEKETVNYDKLLKKAKTEVQSKPKIIKDFNIKQ